MLGRAAQARAELSRASGAGSPFPTSASWTVGIELLEIGGKIDLHDIHYSQ